MINDACRFARRSAAVALAACLSLSQAVWAEPNDPKSGTYWYRQCTSPEPILQIECAIYVRALVEYDELRGTALERKRFFCPEKGLTIGQSRVVVIEFLRNNRQDLHLPFVLLAHRALAAAYPCPNEPDPRADSPSR